MEFQLNYLKSWKMMLLKCCTQYARKFGKFSGGHRTGKISFHSNPKEGQCQWVFKLPYNLHSLNMLARLCSKSFRLGFSSMWTKNFQMYKLGFEEAEEPETKLPIFVGSWRKQGSSRKKKIVLLFYWLFEAFNYVGHNKLWETLKETGVPYHLICLLRKLTCNTWLVQNWEMNTIGYVLLPCLFNFCA